MWQHNDPSAIAQVILGDPLVVLLSLVGWDVFFQHSQNVSANLRASKHTSRVRALVHSGTCYKMVSHICDIVVDR